MESNTTTTKEMISIPRDEYEALKAQNKELAQQVQWLMEQMRLSKQKQFGSSSEKSKYDTLNLFNEAEATTDQRIAEPELSEVQNYHRKKMRESNDKLPDDLPVEIIEHFLPADEQECPECGTEMHIMGKEIRRELKIIPAKAIIVEHIDYVYACRDCERNGDNVPIIKAPMGKPVIKKSFASPEAVAHIMTQKFANGLPLYRQEQDFNRMGICLSRQTMSNWFIRCAEDWLEPIYNNLREILCVQPVIHADETVLQVLKEPGKSAQSKRKLYVAI